MKRRVTKRSAPASKDMSRLSSTGAPSNYISYATVGHMDLSPAYARLEGSRVLVEVTLMPAGDEIMAVLPVAEGTMYSGLQYGQHVLVGMPGGTGQDATILCAVSDESWPFPSSVAGVEVPPEVPNTPVGAPIWSFVRTAAGQLLAIETGEGADLVIHSGGSVRLGCVPGEQLLLSGRTHIGQDFTSPPVGAQAGPGGEVVPGTQGSPYVPVPYVPVPAVPAPALPAEPFVGPEDGIVRAKDLVQIDALTDPGFWRWVVAVSAAPQVAAAMALTGVLVPLSATAQHKTASLHTCADD